MDKLERLSVACKAGGVVREGWGSCSSVRVGSEKKISIKGV